jgi:fibronectin type 3 domain-containing protein
MLAGVQMKRIHFVILLLLLPLLINAQNKKDFFTMVKSNTLTLFLTEPLSVNEAYKVYRKTDTGYVLLTKEPISAIVDPTEARLILDKDWRFIARAVDSDNEMEIMRTIKSKTFRGAILSLVSNNAAKVAGRWFEDKDIELGKTYTYKYVFEAQSGRAVDTLIKTITAKKNIPNPPQDLKLITGNKQIKLSWAYPKWQGDFNDLGFKYNIYRKFGLGKFEKVNDNIIIRDDSSDPEYQDLWLEEGIEYSYKVTISDPVGNESKASNVATILLKDNTPPSIVKNVLAAPDKNGMRITWNMSTELDIKGYNIYRSTSLKGTFKKINDKLVELSTPFYIDSTSSEKKQYFYTVSAVDKAGNIGKQSNPNSVYLKDIYPPSSPSNLSYKVVNNKVHLSWNPSKAKDLNGYFVYKSERKTGMKSRITLRSIKNTSYVDEGTEGKGFGYGANFYYSITAVDSSNNESEKLNIFVNVPDIEAPKPPNYLSTKLKGDHLFLSCGMSSSTDAFLYKLYRSEKKDQTLMGEFSKAPFMYKDTSLKKGVEYIYSVSVIDTAGNVSETTINDTIIYRDYTPPPAPRNVKALFSSNGVKITWVRSVDYDMAGYNIYRSDYPSGSFKIINKSVITDTEFMDVIGTKKNYYRVKAIDTSGNESKYDKTIITK